jgi:hypothetical protein
VFLFFSLGHECYDLPILILKLAPLVSKEGWSLIKHLYFAPRYDIGEKAFELNPSHPNPSKLIQAYQDYLKNPDKI